jgi:predicted aspartyl protease
MNIRSGPGTNYSLLGVMPNGKRVTWQGPAVCVPRQDGIRGADWCKVNVANGQLAPVGGYYNQVGWVSRSGLMPVYEEETPRATADPKGLDAPGDGLVCDRPQVILGDEPRDPNPVTWIEVSYAPADHAWRIFHHFQNGGVVSRSEQYALVDNTSANKVQWSGSLNRNRSLFMVGEVKEDGYYYEWLYNRSHNNQLEMTLRSKCHLAEATPRRMETVTPNYVPQRPVQTVPVRPVKDSVPIHPVGDGMAVALDVLIGGNPVRMLLDTGAMMIQITPDLAAKIVMERQGSYGRWANFTMADGRKVKQQIVNIETIKIGSHTLHNVEASVSEGALIMAFPVVNSIAPFKIDTRNRELVFDGVEARG